MRFNGAVERDSAIDAWMKEHPGELGAMARQWFEVMRKCGDEVRELLHDLPGCMFWRRALRLRQCNHFARKQGFFHGAALPDPARLCKAPASACHVKLRPGTVTNTATLSRLIDTAFWYKRCASENG